MGFRSDMKNCNFGDNDLADDGGGANCDSGDSGDGFGSVSCSICLETVVDHGDRSWAKLQCGHQFHLDCIGSAFNAKGMMQCPNCRKVEKGQWLYANGCRSLPEFSIEDWAHEEEIYDLGYSEMSFGVHWCPFGSLARLPSFEDGEFSASSYHDLLGSHGFFTEQAGAASSAGHPCPYVAYFGPVHPSSSNSTAGVSDSSTFSNHWNSGSSVTGEVPTPYGYHVDPHYHNWEYHSPPFSASGSHIGSPTQPTVAPPAPRTSRTTSEVFRPRPAHFARPFFSHSSSGRAGSSVTSVSRAPPYPGSNARTRNRVQALQAYYQQSPAQPHSTDTPAVSHMPIVASGRRSTRGGAAAASSQIASMASSSDQQIGFTRFNIWERDHHRHHHLQQQQPQQQPVSLNQIDIDSSHWTAFHQAADGSGNFHQRHAS